MRYTSLICSAVICGAMAVGCEKKEEVKSPPAAAAPANPPAAMPAPAPTATPAVPAAPATAAADTASVDAQSKLDLVMTYVKDHKYDLADKTLKELEDNKASLPASVQQQLPTARTALTTAKAGAATTQPGGITLPSLAK
jgi:hypothetical protein